MERKPSRFKAGILFIIGLTVIFQLTLYFSGGEFFNEMGQFAQRLAEQLELKSYDLRAQQLHLGTPKKRASRDIVILTFDDSSLNVLNDEFGSWPWARDVHAHLIHYLNRIGVRTMLYDIMFVSHRKGGEKSDQLLIDAFHQYDNVYLSMNFDNELLNNQKLGKDLTPGDIEMLRPLSIQLRSELDSASEDTVLKTRKDEDGTVFFDNNHMRFNHYRSIMPSLLSKGENIGIINHWSDVDGVSRSNPLFFQFDYHAFIKTQNFPLIRQGEYWLDSKGTRVDASGFLMRQSKFLPATRQKNGLWLDHNPANPQRVDEMGYYLDSYGHPVYLREQSQRKLYFPYLGLKAILDYKYPHQKPELLITREGHLKFGDYDIPLSPRGDYLLNWYNENVIRDDASQYLDKLTLRRRQLEKNLDKVQNHSKIAAIGTKAFEHTRQNIQQIREELFKTIAQYKVYEEYLRSDYTPQPYRVISAWEVIRTMKKEEAGQPLGAEDIQLKKFLKNKIIFVGATAVAAYDIKNTSIYASLPGVVLQANIFDNLYQNDHQYLQRVDPRINTAIAGILCLLVIAFTFRMQSPLAGLMLTGNIAVIYVLIAIYLFRDQDLWVDIVMPLVCLVLTVTIAFMLKYFFRNKDYEKTYALATTDSMTGLYNHRFFQDQLRISIDQANRFKHKFSLLLIDIDFFKKFNDSYGHQAGDEVLRQVARKLKKNVRNVDIVARYGGEEMAIILDRANEEEALAVALKIVQSIAEEAYPIAEGVAKHVTISCGVATYPSHGNSPSQLIEFSDQGLYRAKENGRNQVGAQYDSDFPPDGQEEQQSDVA